MATPIRISVSTDTGRSMSMTIYADPSMTPKALADHIAEHVGQQYNVPVRYRRELRLPQATEGGEA